MLGQRRGLLRRRRLISRFFVGLTPGYYNPELTAEDVAGHLDEIRAEDGYIVPEDISGEISKIIGILKGTDT